MEITISGQTPGPTTPEESTEKHLVNPVALRQCFVKYRGVPSRVLDLSYVRVVFEAPSEPLPKEESIAVELQLDRHEFSVTVSLMTEGEGWARCLFDKMLPSAQAHLRSFLSPKKIGESIVEDWRTEEIRHFHGLNESELWIQTNGTVMFTYLDSTDGSHQFLIRMIEGKPPLLVGRVSRKDYMNMSALDAELNLEPMPDREVYLKLGDCRDIVTNFRPTGQIEYNLKQKLLKVVSDNLYSTNNRVEFTPPPRVVTTQPET